MNQTEKTCFHCGLEVPEHLHLTVRYENEDHETCCAGCQAVAQSIIDAGLGNYYKQRTADAEKSELPPPEMLSQLKLYDLPEVQADFVEARMEWNVMGWHHHTTWPSRRKAVHSEDRPQ